MSWRFLQHLPEKASCKWGGRATWDPAWRLLNRSGGWQDRWKQRWTEGEMEERTAIQEQMRWQECSTKTGCEVEKEEENWKNRLGRHGKRLRQATLHKHSQTWYTRTYKHESCCAHVHTLTLCQGVSWVGSGGSSHVAAARNSSAWRVEVEERGELEG